MDPKTDQPQPQEFETQEKPSANDSGLVLKFLSQADILDGLREAAFDRLRKIDKDSDNLSEIVHNQLPAVPDSVMETTDTFIDTTGRQITVELKRGVSGPYKEHLYPSSMSFADPKDSQRRVVINNEKSVGLEFGDRPDFVVSYGNRSTNSRFLNYEWGYSDGPEYKNPPDRDPLDAAREGLDYFLQHASELKPVEPTGGQTPPPVPNTPPAQPAPVA